MNQAVKVQSNDQGAVIVTNQNNPEYGYVRVTQTRLHFDENGFMKPIQLSALIKGKVEDLKVAGFTAGQALPGKIAVKESLTPPNPNNVEQDMKMAGSTGIPCMVDDQPIYRTTFYTSNANLEDIFIPHTNGDQLKQAAAAARVKDTAGADLSA